MLVAARRRLRSRCRYDELLEQLHHLSEAKTVTNGDWAQGVLSRAASGPRGSKIAADAGRDLARRLVDGPVRLDRFELRSELGVGTFGYVFEAWDPRLERVVALKVQRAGSLASHEDVERFQREARSAAQLKHPAIVSLYETGQTEDNVWFLVCEYVSGKTLEDRLKSGAMDPAQAIKSATCATICTG